MSGEDATDAMFSPRGGCPQPEHSSGHVCRFRSGAFHRCEIELAIPARVRDRSDDAYELIQFIAGCCCAPHLSVRELVAGFCAPAAARPYTMAGAHSTDLADDQG